MGLLSILASILGKFNVCGVAGVSCVIGNNGFSINGNSGSNNDVLANCCCIFPSAVSAEINGLGSPIFAAFSANACCNSDDIFIGLNIFCSIDPTTNLTSTETALLSPIEKVIAGRT